MALWCFYPRRNETIVLTRRIFVAFGYNDKVCEISRATLEGSGVADQFGTVQSSTSRWVVSFANLPVSSVFTRLRIRFNRRGSTSERVRVFRNLDIQTPPT